MSPVSRATVCCLYCSTRAHVAFNAFNFTIVSAGRRKSGNVTITLGHILKFATGSNAEPVFGYGIEPSMETSSLPSANTCVNKLVLPLDVAADREDNFRLYDYAFSSDYFGAI